MGFLCVIIVEVYNTKMVKGKATIINDGSTNLFQGVRLVVAWNYLNILDYTTYVSREEGFVLNSEYLLLLGKAVVSGRLRMMPGTSKGLL